MVSAPVSGFDEQSLREIGPALPLRVGENMQVEYKVVDTIPLGCGGKPKLFISTVGKPEH